MGHVSHRTKRTPARTAARVALVLGIVAFTGALLDFAFHAYESSDCFTPGAQYDSGVPMPRDAVASDECRELILRRDEHQRTDATIAMLAIVVVMGGAVRLSNASRRTQRILLTAEIVVVAVGIVYIGLLTLAFR